MLGQDVSVAGKRAGLKHEENGDDETTRSGLFFEAIRIIKEMRNADIHRGRTDVDVRCRFGLLENVPGLLSSNNGNDFRTVLEEMARISEDRVHVPKPTNYEWGGWSNAGTIIGDSFSIAWRVHDARLWGVPQRRRRISVLADFNGLLAPEILFERDTRRTPGSEVQSFAESVCWDPPTSGAEGKDPEDAAGIGESLGKTGESYTFRNHFDGRVVREESLCLDTCGGVTDSQCSSGSETDDDRVAATLTASYGTKWNGNEGAYTGENFVYGFPLGFRPENVRCYEETSTTICNGTRPGFTNGIVTGEKK